MKRLIFSVLIISIIFCSCGKEVTESKKIYKSRGVWLSCYELSDMLMSSNGFSNEIKSVIENCKELMIDNVYIHIRSHCDSIFQSDFFPLNENAKIYDYDIFEYMLTEFHNNKIKVHAWINPYRVSSSSNVTDLRSDSPAFLWLNDAESENDLNVLINDGIYLNPASSQVRTLIINGVREVVSKYAVDGIAFDDYFYPTSSEEFDRLSYQNYKNSTKTPLGLSDWRRTNVNLLISGCYNAIKSQNEEILFTVSPAHLIEKNYNQLYADVEYWIKNEIVDVIMPQIYFGFLYPDKQNRFDVLLEDWKKIVTNNVKLVISLPSYKIGTDSQPDFEEWNTQTDIIARQAEICYNDNKIDGFVIFSYSSLFSENELNLKQRNNLKDMINNFEFLEKNGG